MRRLCSDRMVLGAGLASLSFGNAVLLPVLVPVALDVGLTEAKAGLVLSLGALMVPLTAPVWGARADRIGAAHVFRIGVAGGALSFLLLALLLWAAQAGHVMGVALFLALAAARMLYGGVASAALPAAVSHLAADTDPATRTRDMSLPGTAFTLGSLAGAALALPLIPLAGPIAPLFVVAALGGLCVLLAPPPRDAAPPPATVPAGMRRAVPSGLVICAALAMTGLAMAHALLPVLLQARGALSVSETVRSGAFAGLVATIATLGGIRLAARAGRGPATTALAGTLVAGAGMLALALAPGVAGTIAAVSTLSFGLGLLTPSLQAQVSLEARAQGQAAGQLSAATGLAWIVGPAAGLTLHGVFGAAILPAAAALLLPFAAALAGRIAVQAR